MLSPASASFDITFDNDVTKEYVENAFSIKPAKKTEVVELNKKYYKLTVVNGLEEDQIYNVEEKTTSGTKKWVFQTEKVFRVEYTYPEDKSIITETGTPEIAFNGKIADDINKYITISPNVSGTWKEMYSYNYHFEHNKHFDHDKTYEITIKKGLKDVDGNELKEDYKFSFSISNEKEQDIAANLEILNVYKPNANIDLTMDLYMNLDKALSINSAKLKILNLG